MSTRKISKSVLIMGETGAGKSTFINTLTNYFLKGSLEQLRVAIPTRHFQATEGYAHTENDTSDISMSQTNDCTTYVFEEGDCRYNFIDTPGLNDTRNSEHDEKNLQKILDLAKKTTDLVAVLLIINGTQSRLTPAMENIVTILKGHLPDRVMSQLIVVLSKASKTNTAFERSTLAAIAPNIQKNFIFYMNNTAFVAKPKNGRIVPTAQLSNEWAASMQGCKKIVTLVRSLERVPVEDFQTVMKHRFRIKGCLHNMKNDMIKYQRLEEQLEVAQQRERDLATNAAAFKNFTRREETKVMVKRKTPHHNTICSQCDHACHQRCRLQEVTEKGSNHFISCIAIDGTGKCRQCPGKCSHTEHYHAKHIFVEETQTVEKVLEDMKAQFEQATQERHQVALQIDDFNNAKNAIESTMQTIMDTMIATFSNLKQLCSGFNFADELRVTYNQLALEAKKVKSVSARGAITLHMTTLQKAIDFHSDQPMSLQDIKAMRADLDEPDSSDDDADADNVVRSVQRRKCRGYKRRAGQRPVAASSSALPVTPTPAATNVRFPEKTRAPAVRPTAFVSDESDDDSDDDIYSLSFRR